MAEPQDEEVTSSNPEPAGEAVRQPADDQQPNASAPPVERQRPTAAPPPPPIGERDPIKPEAAGLQQALTAAWSGIPYESRVNFGDLEVTLAVADLHNALSTAKTDPTLAFDYFMSLTGVDYESYIELVYHLYSYRHHHRLTLKTKLEDPERASAPSVTGLWRGADWHERETAEMLGMDFPGHPNLVPLLLDEGTDERPLRKSHPLVPIYEDRPGLVRKPDDRPY